MKQKKKCGGGGGGGGGGGALKKVQNKFHQWAQTVIFFGDF